MARIKMLETIQGSDDGLVVKTYREGEEYTVGESLHKVLVRDIKVAVDVEEPKPEPEPKAEEPKAAKKPQTKQAETHENKSAKLASVFSGEK